MQGQRAPPSPTPCPQLPVPVLYSLVMKSITTPNHSTYVEHSRYFEGLPVAALHAVVQAAQPVRLTTGDYLFHQGDPAQQFYLLCEGQLRLIQITPEGQQIILGLLSPIREVGIVAAIPNAEYPLTAQGISPTALTLAWSSASLTALIEQYPVLAVRAMRMVTGRFVQLQNLYRELATLRVEQRIARALVRLTRQAGMPSSTGGTLISIPLSRQHLADMTGTTLYTVSRTLSAWEQRGIVEARRERVVVRDMDALMSLADDLSASPPPPDPPPC